MKKLTRTIVLLLAAVMVFGMTVFAAASPENNNGGNGGDNTLFNQFQQTNINNGAKLGPCDFNVIELARQYMSWKGLTGEIITAVDIVGAANTDYTLTASYIDANGSYYLLHYLGSLDAPDYTAFEQIGTTTNANSINFKTTEHTSPFVIVKGTAPATAAVVAPKTGEVIAISAILALIMMAGAVVCAKKARLQK